MSSCRPFRVVSVAPLRRCCHCAASAPRCHSFACTVLHRRRTSQMVAEPSPQQRPAAASRGPHRRLRPAPARDGRQRGPIRRACRTHADRPGRPTRASLGRRRPPLAQRAEDIPHPAARQRRRAARAVRPYWAGPGADVGAVAAQMWAQSRRRCGPHTLGTHYAGMLTRSISYGPARPRRSRSSARSMRCATQRSAMRLRTRPEVSAPRRGTWRACSSVRPCTRRWAGRQRRAARRRRGAAGGKWQSSRRELESSLPRCIPGRGFRLWAPVKETAAAPTGW